MEHIFYEKPDQSLNAMVKAKKNVSKPDSE